MATIAVGLRVSLGGDDSQEPENTPLKNIVAATIMVNIALLLFMINFVQMLSYLNNYCDISESSSKFVRSHHLDSRANGVTIVYGSE